MRYSFCGVFFWPETVLNTTYLVVDSRLSGSVKLKYLFLKFPKLFFSWQQINDFCAVGSNQ